MTIKACRMMMLFLFVLVGNAVSAQGLRLASTTFDQLPAQEQTLLKAATALWPKLDGNTQAQLRAQAKHWLTLSPAEQQTLLLKQRQWDGFSFAEKSKERSRFAAWQSLGKITGGFPIPALALLLLCLAAPILHAIQNQPQKS